MGKEHLATGNRQSPVGAVLLFTTVSIVILCGGYFFFRYNEHHLRRSREKELNAIVCLKSERLQEWRQELLANGRMVVDSPSLQDNLSQWMHTQDSGIAGRALSRLRSFQRNCGFQDVLFVDVDGKVCLSLLDSPTPLGKTSLECLRSALIKGEPVLTELYQITEEASPQLDVIAPLFATTTESKTVLGAIILRVDPGRYLYPLLKAWPSLSETAETLLVRKEGDRVIFLNEPRHQKDNAFRLGIPLEKIDDPAVQAIASRRGPVEGTDYRGVKVLAVIEPVGDSSWFLIAKMDAKEAFSVWWTHNRAVLGIALILLAGILGSAAFYWQHQRSQQYLALYHSERERLALVKHFEYLIKYANDIILLAGDDARIIEANDRAVSAYGYSREELREMSLSSLIAPDEHDNHLMNIQESQEEGFAFYETVHKRKDGSLFDVEVSTRFIEIDGVPFLQKIIRDITDRKRAQEELEHSERKFRLLFQNLTAGFALTKILVDEEGIPVDCLFVEVNPAFELMTGRKVDDITGQRFSELFPGADPHWVECFGKAGLTGIPQRMEQHSAILNRDFDVLAYSPQLGFCAAVFNDITERKLAEQTRENLLKSLEEKTEEMESLLYVSSHDLRTPLVNIQGFSQRLDKATNELAGMIDQGQNLADLQTMARSLLHERIPAALRYIVASANKMDSLINGLLRISRLGRVQINMVKIDMDNLVANVLASQKHQLQQAEASTPVGSLPTCWGDPTQINQIFSNLVDNALKYGSGHKPLTVRIHGEVQDDMAVYCVEDTGPGIKPEHQDKVWGLFSRLDPGGQVAGEGLGLTVVKRIVQRHRGRVWLESEPNQGSKFFVALPRKAIPVDSVPRDSSKGMGES